MSGQIDLSNGLNPLAHHPLSRPSASRTGPRRDMVHGRAGPDSPWCRCGRPREACVSDTVRELWTALHRTGR